MVQLDQLTLIVGLGQLVDLGPAPRGDRGLLTNRTVKHCDFRQVFDLLHPFASGTLGEFLRQGWHAFNHTEDGTVLVTVLHQLPAGEDHQGPNDEGGPPVDVIAVPLRARKTELFKLLW